LWDEQHRFGVAQRASYAQDEYAPPTFGNDRHTYPRDFGYESNTGDLDISTIRLSLPREKKTIKLSTGTIPTSKSISFYKG